MMRLSKPKYSFETTLDECIAGITGNTLLENKLTSSKPVLIAAGGEYLNVVGIGKLHTILPINTDVDNDPVVISSLKKSDLVKIYEQYFVAKSKPARKIYDALLNAAKEKCPFCGGIGTPRNLDHFLPKKYFPQFSVLPHNLVPSCRDCNMDGKGSAFATNAEDQIIQPYADKDIFFSEQWIFATYHEGNATKPGEFEYYTLPPDNWSAVDKARVRKHFKDFNLAKRYGDKAGQQLGTVLLQINRMEKAGVDRENIKNCLLQSGVDAAPFANHWQMGMYQTLIKSFST